MSDESLLCHRCGTELQPGQGDFYVVRIEAFADPSPPDLTPEDLLRDHEAEIRRMIETLKDVSDQEAMDQVYRKVTIHLCAPCYRRWIENPAGG